MFRTSREITDFPIELSPHREFFEFLSRDYPFDHPPLSVLREPLPTTISF